LNEAYPLYDSDDEDADHEALEEARRIGGWTYYSKLLSTSAHNVGAHVASALRKITPVPKPTPIPRTNGVLNALGNGQIQIKHFKAPRGKKIHVPVRVEPKVYFAAERTFLAWLEFSIYIGTIAVTLLNFGAKPTKISFLAAGTFSLVAIISLLYSVGIYLYRAEAIRGRKAIKYHDKYGPTVLCGALFVAVVINAVFELSDRGFI